MLILDYSIAIAIILRSISSIILLFFCIPLQIKEARVKNGLRLLRIQLLAFGITLLMVNIISLYALVLVVPVYQHYTNSLLQVINAAAFLFLAVVGHTIYTTQYSDENKESHRIMEEQKTS